MQKYISPDEVCALIPGMSKNNLAQMRYRGAGPKYRKLGKLVVYTEEECREWVEANTRTGTAAQA